MYRFRRDEDGVLRSYISRGGTKDGIGWGDNDRPYTGFCPSYFNQWEYMRLLLLRGQIQDARWLRGRYLDDLQPDTEDSASDEPSDQSLRDQCCGPEQAA